MACGDCIAAERCCAPCRGRAGLVGLRDPVGDSHAQLASVTLAGRVCVRRDTPVRSASAIGIQITTAYLLHVITTNW